MEIAFLSTFCLLTLAQNSHVIMKLLFFTLAMIVVPIGSYYATVNTIFRGE